MSYDSLNEREKFKKMVENNRAILVELNNGEPARACKCDNPHWYEHLFWMLDECLSMFELSPNKANRWLGYVQGCMSKDGVSLERLKDANRVGE